jgi:hypothetical protein
MSYDISISLLRKNFYKTILVKALGKGELISERRAGGQSNMTTSFPRQYPASTLNHSRATAVPSEYSARDLSPFLSEITFVKQNRHWAR